MKYIADYCQRRRGWMVYRVHISGITMEAVKGPFSETYARALANFVTK